MNVDPGFWRGKRVFLTGHTGFKGGWLSLWLQQLGAQLQGYALAPVGEHSLFAAARVGHGMASTLADIRDLAALQSAMVAFRPEIVIHMAAQPLVRQSYADPVETYATNVMGTVNLLEAVRRAPGVRAVVNVTTDKCYENDDRASGYAEGEPMGGHDPYSSSKGCAELVTSAYRRSFFSGGGAAVATARAGNVIGGGDWASDRLVPDILRAFERGEPVVIRNPNATRPWQHVLEPLGGYLLLGARLAAEPLRYHGAWNFGPHLQDALPVGTLADIALQAWGGGSCHTPAQAGQPHEAGLLKLDISKAVNQLGWHPRYTAVESIQSTIAWYKALAGGTAAADLVRANIAAYCAPAS